ncbi:MAG: TlpA family protein disulfide reductase [Chloroflexi bacterium]|nr:TlpA family protein disulfide reductase [Chloroflexota bacterium]
MTFSTDSDPESDEALILDDEPESQRRKYFVMAIAFVPLVLVAALLIWGTVRGGGTPGGIFVNNAGGAVEIKNKVAPDFTFVTFQGEVVTLAELRGKVVFLDFWASWCPPCRAEAPTLRYVSEQFVGQDVVFVGIDVWEDKVGAGQRFARESRWDYPTGLDPNGAITIDYGVKGLPEKFFIDREGNLVRKWIGPIDTVRLTEILDELLAEPVPVALAN